MVNKRDKESLIIAAFIVVFIFGSVILNFVTSSVNPAVVIGIVTLAEVFFIVPRVNKLYMEVLEADDNSFARFIPIWNELRIFSPKMFYACLALWIINAIVLLLSFVSGGFITRIFGEDFATVYTPYMLIAAAVIFLINSIVRGFAFCEIKRNVAEMNADLMGVPEKVTPYSLFQSFTLFIPILRVVGLSLVSDRLYKLAELNGYNAQDGDNEFVEENE